nr:MAG TPA: hypothetical protein [Caudoviricetes sp.]
MRWFSGARVRKSLMSLSSSFVRYRRSMSGGSG